DSSFIVQAILGDSLDDRPFFIELDARDLQCLDKDLAGFGSFDLCRGAALFPQELGVIGVTDLDVLARYRRVFELRRKKGDLERRRLRALPAARRSKTDQLQPSGFGLKTKMHDIRLPAKV